MHVRAQLLRLGSRSPSLPTTAGLPVACPCCTRDRCPTSRTTVTLCRMSLTASRPSPAARPSGLCRRATAAPTCKSPPRLHLRSHIIAWAQSILVPVPGPALAHARLSRPAQSGFLTDDVQRWYDEQTSPPFYQPTDPLVRLIIATQPDLIQFTFAPVLAAINSKRSMLNPTSWARSILHFKWWTG